MTNEKQLSKLLGILVEHMVFFKNLSTEDAQWIIEKPKEAISLFLSAVAERSKGAMKRIITPFTEFNLQPVSEHGAKDCFQNDKKVKFWRDKDLDTWTPQKRKAHEGGEYITQGLTESSSFREMSISILNVSDEKISDEELQKQIIKAGHCVEMKQIDQKIKRFETNRGNSPLSKDGKVTFFFVNNQDESVSVIGVRWYSGDGKWSVSIFRFDYGSRRWFFEDRVVSRKCL
jgi:hypothetical protein